jgi:hypothetical protein
MINVTAIDTQGNGGALQFVKSYRIKYTVKYDSDYIDYVENGGVAKVRTFNTGAWTTNQGLLFPTMLKLHGCFASQC